MDLHAILHPFKEMIVGAISFIPTLVTLIVSLAILGIGWVLAKTITKLVVQLMRGIHFDKGADKIGLSKVLKKGDVRQKPSNLIGCIAYWTMMVMVLITTIKALGIGIANDFLHKLFMYLPHVVIGAVTLIIGMLLAKAVSVIVYVTAKNADMPIPETLRDLSKLAIVVYVTVIYLKEVGLVTLFTGTHYTIVIGGVIFALALAFGLAGKDIASKYLGVFDKHS